MPVSLRTEYATRALLELALGTPTCPVKTSEIALRQRIPEKSLEQILLTFKKQGLVRSKPGLHGGFTLSRSPDQISIAQIIRAVDGPLAPVPCVSDSAYAACSCPDETACPFRDTWRQARDAMVRVLEGVSLAAVADRARERARVEAATSDQQEKGQSRTTG